METTPFTLSTFSEYEAAYKAANENPEKFWENIALRFQWQQKWNKVLEWDFENYNTKWFLNGKLNITENCIDRHLPHKANDTAFIWESNFEDKPNRIITYQNLHDEVCRIANALKQLGVKKGDRVCIYLPMITEAALSSFHQDDCPGKMTWSLMTRFLWVWKATSVLGDIDRDKCVEHRVGGRVSRPRSFFRNFLASPDGSLSGHRLFPFSRREMARFSVRGAGTLPASRGRGVIGRWSTDRR